MEILSANWFRRLPNNESRLTNHFFKQIIQKHSVKINLFIDVYRGPWGGNKCRDSPVQTLRDCSCAPNECQACDNYLDQFKDVLQHSAPKGGKIAVLKN